MVPPVVPQGLPQRTGDLPLTCPVTQSLFWHTLTLRYKNTFCPQHVASPGGFSRPNAPTCTRAFFCSIVLSVRDGPGPASPRFPSVENRAATSSSRKSPSGVNTARNEPERCSSRRPTLPNLFIVIEPVDALQTSVFELLSAAPHVLPATVVRVASVPVEVGGVVVVAARVVVVIAAVVV